jgi:hypothetical protein
MSTFTYRIIVIGLLSVFFSCTKNELLHENFSLKLNQCARIPLEETELKIKFSKLIEDSRCPPDAYCTGMGRTIIAIELNDSTYVIGPDSSSITYGSYNIKLQQVSYNTKRNFGKERHCRITLRVD